MFNPLLLPDLRQMLDEHDAQALSEFCNVLHPATTAEVLEGLDGENIWEVLDHCSLERQVEVFEYLSPARQIEMVDDVDRERLSKLVEHMSADDRVDLLSRMDPEHVDALLPLIAQVERAEIRKMLSYPEHSAGSIMTTEYAWLPENITVREALDRLRQQAPDRETIYYIYILDEGRRLDGFLSLRDLILARPSAKLADIMQRDVIAVRVDDDQEAVAQEMAKYDFLAIPVVDNQNRLVGIITYDDVLDVVQEEATEDAYRQGGVEPLEDSYLDAPLYEIAWKRGIWLLFLACVALMTAEVLSHYSAVTETYKWLVLFLPLIIASGGNAGSQSATLVIRQMALGELTRNDNIRLLRRELAVSAALALCPAVVGSVAAFVLFGLQGRESGVVAITAFLVVVMGTVTGAMLPLLFKRIGMDPALMSNPLIAAIVDVLGVLIYYSAALALLGGIGN